MRIILFIALLLLTSSVSAEVAGMCRLAGETIDTHIERLENGPVRYWYKIEGSSRHNLAYIVSEKNTAWIAIFASQCLVTVKPIDWRVVVILFDLDFRLIFPPKADKKGSH